MQKISLQTGELIQSFAAIAMLGSSKKSNELASLSSEQIEQFLNEMDDMRTFSQISDEEYSWAMKGLTIYAEENQDEETLKVIRSFSSVFGKKETKEESSSAYTNTFYSYVSNGMNLGRGLWSKGRNYISKASTYDNPWKQKKHEITLKMVLEALTQKFPKISEYIQENRHIKIPLKKMTAELLELLQSGTKAEDFREAQKNFLILLRTTLDSEEFKKAYLQQTHPIEVGLILDLAYLRFTSIENYSFCESVVENGLRFGASKNESEVDEIEFYEQFDVLKKEVPKPYSTSHTQHYISKLRSGANINYDPHWEGNLPYVLYRLPIANLHGEKKVVTAIRTGTPTYEATPYSASINSEFKGFLKACAFKKQKHLYINLQARNSWTEANRCRAINDLRDEFRGTFETCTLDQDSSWYKQEEMFANIGSFDAFISTFKEQLMDPKSGYWFPEEWKADPEFQKAIDTMMTQIHQDLFSSYQLPEKPSKDDLKKFLEIRKNFIEIFHTELSLYLIRYTNADSFNLSCKDAIDRGGKENTKMFRLFTILLDQERNKVRQREERTIMHAAAFLVKKRQILSGRKVRLGASLTTLQDPTVISNLSKRSKEFGIDSSDNLSIKKDESQAIPFEDCLY